VDRKEAEELLQSAGAKGYLAVGKPLMEVGGLIEHGQLYVGVDTGPTHIAGVLGATSVVLAHQNEPTWLPSYNPNATLIWNKEKCVCRVQGEVCVVSEDGELYRRCVYYIPDEEIQGAIRRALADSA
jgi:ADP-heptose:LPS heptosyltransferase